MQTKWSSLEHNGILFPAAYIPHNKPMLYEGAEVVLTPEQEEVASMWALMPESYQQQPTFAKNFFRDFKALFPKDSHIKELAKVNKKKKKEERQTEGEGWGEREHEMIGTLQRF